MMKLALKLAENFPKVGNRTFGAFAIASGMLVFTGYAAQEACWEDITIENGTRKLMGCASNTHLMMAWRNLGGEWVDAAMEAARNGDYLAFLKAEDQTQNIASVILVLYMSKCEDVEGTDMLTLPWEVDDATVNVSVMSEIRGEWRFRGENPDFDVKIDWFTRILDVKNEFRRVTENYFRDPKCPKDGDYQDNNL